MRDKRTGEISYGYGRRERVEHVGTMLPHGAPSEYADPECLFHAIEAVERRMDARPAKKIMVALPRECVLSSCYRPVWREFSFRKSGRF